MGQLASHSDSALNFLFCAQLTRYERAAKFPCLSGFSKELASPAQQLSWIDRSGSKNSSGSVILRSSRDELRNGGSAKMLVVAQRLTRPPALPKSALHELHRWNSR